MKVSDDKRLIREWMFYERRWKFRDFYFHKVIRRHIFEKYFHKDPVMPIYAGKRVMSIKETNEWIAKKIESGNPFMVSRFGNTELQVLASVLKNRLIPMDDEDKRFFDKWFWRLNNWAGFFPYKNELAPKFADLLLESASQADILAMWHCHMDDYVIKHYLSNSILSFLTRIEPWNAKNPWTRALEGRKVLVIHPFDESIRKQYEKRKLLFNNEYILPDFQLITLKAVQTIANSKDDRFDNWFEALDYMYDEAMKLDFQIAIIGCGAYGMPLAAKLKQAGKQAIHMGGVTQILFGIKGKRWVENPCFHVDFNENWVYPSQEETPKESVSVEEGCYWK